MRLSLLSEGAGSTLSAAAVNVLPEAEAQG